jgi:hypothetical protein
LPVDEFDHFTLLAAAVVMTPSNGVARNAPSPVQASAAASVTIVEASRIDWSADRERLVIHYGPDGELRHDFEFQ